MGQALNKKDAEEEEHASPQARYEAHSLSNCTKYNRVVFHLQPGAYLYNLQGEK